ncbi:MAG: hypothetical protein LBN34_07615 [Clostridiales Family XIII bacterium]|jgi:hypothetical protein|nr:hypothetical protein [Clostridiales Family XIII bacterium]
MATIDEISVRIDQYINKNSEFFNNPNSPKINYGMYENIKEELDIIEKENSTASDNYRYISSENSLICAKNDLKIAKAHLALDRILRALAG